MSDHVRAFRASILHCLADPGDGAPGDAVEYLDDGILLVEGGRVAALRPAAAALPELAGRVPVADYRGRLLVPGFTDCHVHYPQIGMVASWGEQLLEWLERYTYPAERRFADREVAERVAADFVDLMLAHGTTSALIFPTVHPVSVDAIFGAAQARRLRIAAGKVLMDRNCPADLRDTPETAYTESKALIERWHGQDRLAYAITPRFAISSTPAQLAAAGRLAEEFPDVLVHTHLAENTREVERVAALFPEADSYLDVYRRAGLLRERAVFAHCLHLGERDHRQLATGGAAIAFCPGSNLFMGSGLFDLARARSHGIPVGLGTDVGAGTSLSLPVTAGEAYKVLELRGQRLTPWQSLYLMTLGAARALGWDDALGSLQPGKEADFVVLDPAATPLAQRRLAGVRSLEETLFALTMLGDDRSVIATYVLGERAWPRPH